MLRRCARATALFPILASTVPVSFYGRQSPNLLRSSSHRTPLGSRLSTSLRQAWRRGTRRRALARGRLAGEQSARYLGLNEEYVSGSFCGASWRRSAASTAARSDKLPSTRF
jgi:hypothetical protein